jgi:hypothetical protein
VCVSALGAEESRAADTPQASADIGDMGNMGPPDISVGELDDSPAADGSDTSPKAARFILGHEGSFRTDKTADVVNNRSWFRLEYSKFFHNSFYVQLDTKLNAYWQDDHRAQAEGEQLLFEPITPEAFLQYSSDGGRTSIKLGVQRLIWGESDGGAITDEVSPRNFSELFFIPLEEARLGQFMLNVDYFSSGGNWNFFFNPDPKFNKYPPKGSAYFVDPFDGHADITRDGREYPNEYGARWKKTFDNSDISLMAARLVDNDYVYSLDGVTSTGRLSILRSQQQFTMTGLTFNYVMDKFLVKGEVGFKSPKGFNDAAFQLVEKDVVDSSLGLTYNLGQSNTVGMQLVNSHVRGWSREIVSAPKDSSSLVLNTNLFFLNDTLTVNWLALRSWPYTSYQSSLRTSYKWTENTAVGVDIHTIRVPDARSGLSRFGNDDQIFLRIECQF